MNLLINLLFVLFIELLFKAFLVFINTAYKRGPSVFAPDTQNFLCNQKCQLKGTFIGHVHESL